jgi:hypothetical protein
MNKRLIPLLLLAAIALLLAACTMQTVTEVKSDGSATWTIEYGFTDKELASLQQYGVSSDKGACSAAQSMDSSMPADITFAESKRGDQTFCTFTKTFKTLDELKTYITKDMTGMTVNRLEIVNGKFYYDITPGSTSDTSSLDMLGLTMDFNWKLVVPGTVGANNATKVEGNTLSWNLLAKNLPKQFTAESTLGGGGILETIQSNVLYIAIAAGCCLLLVVVIVVVVIIVVARRKKPAPAA